jgi:hypothetical protein
MAFCENSSRHLAISSTSQVFRAAEVNIGEYRLRSEDRSGAGFGGRWCRIVLGDVLAEHVVQLRGRTRVWPYVEVAGALAAAAPLGMPSGKIEHRPGRLSKPVRLTLHLTISSRGKRYIVFSRRGARLCAASSRVVLTFKWELRAGCGARESFSFYAFYVSVRFILRGTIRIHLIIPYASIVSYSAGKDQP